MTHPRQPFLTLIVQAMNPMRDSRSPDPLMKGERRRQCPSIFEGMKTARRYPRRLHAFRRLAAHPRRKGTEIKRRHGRAHRLPGVCLRPDKAGPAWAKNPLVRSGDEEVAAHLGDPFVFHPEAVDAVNDQKNAIRFGSPAVDFPDRLRDASHRALSSRCRSAPR